VPAYRTLGEAERLRITAREDGPVGPGWSKSDLVHEVNMAKLRMVINSAVT